MSRFRWSWGLVLGCASAPVRPPAATPEPAPVAVEPAPVAVSKTLTSDEEALVEVWHQYRACLVNRDGTRALDLVTPETIQDYDRQLELALNATRGEVRELDVLDRYMVLMLRSRLTSEKLRALDGRSVLALAITRGWVGSSMPSDVRIKRIEADVGYVRLVKDGKEVPLDIAFMRRVAGSWRVDLVEVTRATRPAVIRMLEKMAKQEGTDLNGVILLILERLVGEKPDDSIWDPPR